MRRDTGTTRWGHIAPAPGGQYQYRRVYVQACTTTAMVAVRPRWSSQRRPAGVPPPPYSEWRPASVPVPLRLPPPPPPETPPPRPRRPQAERGALPALSTSSSSWPAGSGCCVALLLLRPPSCGPLPPPRSLRHAPSPASAPSKSAAVLMPTRKPACSAMGKLRIETLGISGGRSLTRPLRDARRFPSTRRTETRTHMNTYAAKVWDLSIVQGPFSVTPCPTLA
jgi:hypothetical protein